MNCSELSLFGTCPFYDQTILVTCHLCKLIVKLPQLSEHLIKRHNMHDMDEFEPKKTDEPAKLKTVVEKIKNKLSHGTLTNEIKTSVNLIDKNVTNKNTSPNIVTQNISPVNTSPLSNHSLQTTPKQKLGTNNKTVRVYDPDKHCGVITDSIDPLSGLSNGKDRCLRSLTCKKHPINLRRQVSGRSKPFNELLKEYKKDKPLLPELDTPLKTPQAQIVKQRKPLRKSESLSPSTIVHNSPKLDHKPDSLLLPINQPIFSKNSVFPTVEPSFVPQTVDFKPPCPVSSQKLNLNNLNLQFVKHHPRPSGVTSYNARLTDGGGYTLWNRTQDNLRLILSKTFIETEKFIAKNQEFLNPPPNTIPMGSNPGVKRSFPFTSLIKSSSLSQVDTIHKLNDYLIDGDIFQDDDEDTETSKYVKLNDKNEKNTSLSPSPSSSSSASSSLSHQQFIAQSSKF